MILVLVVLAAIVAVLASAMATEHAEFRSSLERLGRQKAKLMAQAGIQYSLAILQLQPITETLQTDEWYLLGDAGNDSFRVANGVFRIQIVDAASLVDLNTADETQLELMALTSEQIDSLLDWREEGNSPRTEGAKEEFYLSLERPYEPRLGRLDSLDELLLIKGFNADVIFQAPEETSTSGTANLPLYELCTVDAYSANTDPSGQTRTNINNATQQQIQQRGVPQQIAAAIIARRNQGQFTRIGEVLTVPGINNDTAGIILDNFSTTAAPREAGKININTATADVLVTFPEITTDVADAITSRQSAGFTALSELLTVPGVTLQTVQAIGDRFTTKSSVFLVRVEGLVGTTRHAMEAVVGVDGTRARILKVLDAPFNDMRTLWRWQDEPTSETVLGEEL